MDDEFLYACRAFGGLFCAISLLAPILERKKIVFIGQGYALCLHSVCRMGTNTIKGQTCIKNIRRLFSRKSAGLKIVNLTTTNTKRKYVSTSPYVVNNLNPCLKTLYTCILLSACKVMIKYGEIRYLIQEIHRFSPFSWYMSSTAGQIVP